MAKKTGSEEEKKFGKLCGEKTRIKEEIERSDGKSSRYIGNLGLQLKKVEEKIYSFPR